MTNENPYNHDKQEYILVTHALSCLCLFDLGWALRDLHWHRDI